MDATCEIVDWQERMHYIDDATGMCAGLSSFPLKPPYHIHNLPTVISSAAGIDLDEEGLTRIARRNRNLVRAENIRRGMRREDEKPPEDHWRKRFPELEAQLLDGYYKFKGWNERGHSDRGDAARAGPGRRARGLRPAGDLDRGSGRPAQGTRRDRAGRRAERDGRAKKKTVKTIGSTSTSATAAGRAR